MAHATQRLQRRTHHMVERTVGYIPQQKQYVAHTCPADHVFYGGAAGPGKTAFDVNEAIWECIRNPGTHVLILRRRLNELRTIVGMLREWLPAEIATVTKKPPTYTFKVDHPGYGPSWIRLGHANLEDDILQYLGDEYSLIILDEAGGFTKYQRSMIQTRNRTPIEGRQARMLLTSNPGGVGHFDLFEEYIEPPFDDVELLAYFDEEAVADIPGVHGRWMALPPGTRGKPGPYIVWRPPVDPTDMVWQRMNRDREEDGLEPMQMPTRCFIPARVRDNKYLYQDPQYMSTLMAIEDERLRSAYAEGNWADAQEQAFHFDRAIHVVPPMIIRRHWRKWRSIDWGYTDPLCVQWHTYSPELRQIITYRELYVQGLNDEEVCELIKSMTPHDERIDYTVADPSMFKHDSYKDSESHAAEYDRYGVPLTRANNARIAGKARVAQALAIDPRTGKPGWVITSDCPNTWRTIGRMIPDPLKPEDVSKEAEDHAYDCARYGLMSASLMMVARWQGPVKAGRLWSS